VARKKNLQYKEESIYICPCGVEAKDDMHKTYFSWQNLGGTVVMLCAPCADKLHRETINNE
jgi:hypothetical protein